MLGISVPIVLGILLLITLAVFCIARSISRPLARMAASFNELGEGNLTQKIAIRGKDEIADISGSFNQTLDKMQRLIITIKQQTVCLFDVGGRMAGNMDKTASAVNEITSNIQSIKERIGSQVEGVKGANDAVDRISFNITKLNQHIERQGESMAQSSSAVEEMLANIQSVTQTLIKNEQNVTALAEAAEIGRSSLQGVAVDIQAIAHESEGLWEINTVMENISSQTDLLSMNAAIEAAHAGEAGKGFAVVADEIRKLAENSGEQSKTISAILKKIKRSIDIITVSMNTAQHKFEAIDTEVRVVADQEANIRSAMEEQSVGSKQILEAVAELNSITQELKINFVEMVEGSKDVSRESKNLGMLTGEISRRMNEMAGGTESINKAVHEINEMSGLNKETIDVLVREVARFKLE